MLPGGSLQGTTKVIDDDGRLGKLPDVLFESPGIPGLKVQLHGLARVRGPLPQPADVGRLEIGNPVLAERMNARGYDPTRVPLDQAGQSGQRVRLVRKEQAGPLQPLASHAQAMFEVSMIVLVRLGMDNDRVINAGPVHALEQVFRRRLVRGPVRRVRVPPSGLMMPLFPPSSGGLSALSQNDQPVRSLTGKPLLSDSNVSTNCAKAGVATMNTITATAMGTDVSLMRRSFEFSGKKSRRTTVVNKVATVLRPLWTTVGSF